MSLILVLGSNSPSGASFCAHAIQRGYDVIATSRSFEKDRIFLPYKWINQSKLKFEQIDLNKNLRRIEEIIIKSRPTYIVNFASQGMVAQSWDSPTDWMNTNVVCLTALLEVIRRATGLKRYIHFSTPEVYGSTEEWVHENRCYNPSTPYALSRAAGDMAVSLWSRTYGIPSIITRAANVYGEGQQLFRIIPKTFLCCLQKNTLPLEGGGHSERAFVHFDDVARAIISICENGRNEEDYHISPHETISIRDLVNKICNITNTRFEDLIIEQPDRRGKDKSYLLNSEKIHCELGWAPQISLDEGLRRVANWCTSNLDALVKYPQSYQHRP